MNYYTEKILNFFSLSKILKIIIISTLFFNINCTDDNMILLFEEPMNKVPSILDIVSIEISPTSPSVALGIDQQFSAIAHYSDASTSDVTASATWSSSNPAVANINTSGLAESLAEGNTTITAVYSGETANTVLTVTTEVLDYITITPLTPSVALGIDQQFIATAHYSDASTSNVTSSATWTSSNPAVADINTSGLAESLAEGNTTITAVYSGETANTVLTVTTVELVSIDIIPADASIGDIDTIHYIAQGNYSDASTSDITDQVTWSSSNTAAATISNSAGSEGHATGVEAGTTTIQATWASVTGSTSLTVTYVPTWDLKVTTTGANQNMTIDFDGPVNMRIYWGDGAVQTTTSTSITHTYSSAGNYTLQMKGVASRISFNNADANDRLTGILSIVQGIDGLTSFESTFESCDNLTGVIPAGLFDNAPLVTSFQNTFIHCNGLTGSIPSGLFDNNTQVTTFRSTFFGCTGLSGSIPAGLFDNNTLVTTFRSTFTYCGGLSSIPSGLFDNNTLVTTFQNTFHQCLGLTGSIPSGLFDNNTLVTSFYGTFYQCWNLTGSIPSGLFDNNTQVTSFAFTFYDIPGLTGSIPSGLFDNNTLVTSFTATFLGCEGLTGIPSGLFDNNTLVTTFRGIFTECTGLTGIPSGLFDNNTLVTDFYQTFRDCTGVTSAVPTLWISHPGATHGECFMNVTNASNYASIPAAWK